jgi:uncharacterized protein with HEPN domain
VTDDRDDGLYLDHILSCIERIHRYTADGRDVFLSDEMRQDAVVRNLQTLAESTQRLSPALKARHPTIDWRRIGQFRNFIVHVYMSINYQRIWLVVERELDPLEQAVRQALADLGSSPASED